MEKKIMSRCGYQSLIYVFFAWILAACGGGGGGGVDPSAGNITSGGGAASVIRTLELSLTDAQGNPIANNQISNATPGVINASLTDSSGLPVAGEVVTFTLPGSIGSLSPASGTALTQANGVATISLNAGTTAGADTVTATASFAIADSLTFSTLGDSPDNVDDSATTVGTTMTLTATKQSDGSSFTPGVDNISQNEPAILTATLTDASGPIAGRAITFSITQDRGLLSLTDALTNTTGQATVTLTAGSTAGAGTATATFGSTSATVDYQTDGDEQSSSTGPTDITVTLRDQSNNQLTNNTITESTPGLIQVTLIRDGNRRSNRLVTITASNGLLDPRDSSGAASVVTDSNGVATATLLAGGLSGAGTISVVADDSTASDAIAFQIQSADIQIGDNSGASFSQGTLDIATTTLSAGSTTTVTAYLVDANDNDSAYTTPATITFSSNCSLSGKAVIDAAVVTNANGQATATYVSKGSLGSCSGTDLITATATIGGSAITAQSTITVNASPASSISQEGNANPTVIALQNTSGLGRQTSSTLTFKVLDSNGFDAPGVTVNFEASTTIGGITLTPSSATTLADGTVQVQVNAGTVPTPVRVRAYFDQAGTEISTLSEQLSISTGIPDNNSFTISLSELAVLGYDVDGVDVTLTARGADHFNNPAPDGTTFSFISELGGSVDPQCTVSNGEGSCTVNFRTQGTRPTADQTPDVTSEGYNDRFGRTTILAYAIGEESYGDANGDNFYDNGEVVAQLPEAFIDINENGTRDASITPAPGVNEWTTITFEEFTDFNSNTSYDTADTLYNGTLCDAAATTHCQSLVNVRDSAVLILSTRGLRFYVFAGEADRSTLEFVEGDPANNATVVGTPAPSTPKNTVLTGVSSKAATGGGTPYTVSASRYNGAINTVSEIDLVNFASATISIIITDENGNPPANGTSFTFDCSECDISGSGTSTVVNEINIEEVLLTLEQKSGVSKDGTFSVTVNHPDGITTSSGTLFDVNAVP